MYSTICQRMPWVISCWDELYSTILSCIQTTKVLHCKYQISVFETQALSTSHLAACPRQCRSLSGWCFLGLSLLMNLYFTAMIHRKYFQSVNLNILSKDYNKNCHHIFVQIYLFLLPLKAVLVFKFKPV